MKKYQYRNGKKCKCPFCGHINYFGYRDGLCNHVKNTYCHFSADGFNRIEKYCFIFEK